MKNPKSEYRAKHPAGINSKQIFNEGERSKVKAQMPNECQIPKLDSETSSE
jgi:hypothetical protein